MAAMHVLSPDLGTLRNIWSIFSTSVTGHKRHIMCVCANMCMLDTAINCKPMPTAAVAQLDQAGSTKL